MTDNDRILELLDLGRRGPDDFVAPTPSDGPGRLFGGQVASQSLRAATLTVDSDRLPHSLHAYFIRPGRPGIPLRLEVDRTRDGRSFTTRRVTASQDGEPIFALAASFHAAEDGDDWQLPAPLRLPRPGQGHDAHRRRRARRLHRPGSAPAGGWAGAPPLTHGANRTRVRPTR